MDTEGGELAKLLAANPAAVNKILTEHTAGADGRCPVCQAGPQAGKVKWPCRLYALAQKARGLPGQRS